MPSRERDLYREERRFMINPASRPAPAPPRHPHTQAPGPARYGQGTSSLRQPLSPLPPPRVSPHGHVLAPRPRSTSSLGPTTPPGPAQPGGNRWDREPLAGRTGAPAGRSRLALSGRRDDPVSYAGGGEAGVGGCGPRCGRSAGGGGAGAGRGLGVYRRPSQAGVLPGQARHLGGRSFLPPAREGAGSPRPRPSVLNAQPTEPHRPGSCHFF